MKIASQKIRSGDASLAKSKISEKPPLFPVMEEEAPGRDEAQDGRGPSANEERSRNAESEARERPSEMEDEGVETQAIVDAKGKKYTRVLLKSQRKPDEKRQVVEGKQPEAISNKNVPKPKSKGFFRRKKQAYEKSAEFRYGESDHSER
jgi:hypothetical protein